MNVFIGGRQSGKTTKAIEWAAENDATIVCHSKQSADYILHHAEKLGLKIQTPITFDELLGGRAVAGTNRPLIYDNVDMLLAYLARGRRVVGWTATKSELT